jgi:hypothetical protein
LGLMPLGWKRRVLCQAVGTVASRSMLTLSQAVR